MAKETKNYDHVMLLTGELGMEQVTSVWKYTQLKKTGTLRLYLCTEGGEVSSWTAIIDLLSDIRARDQLVTVAMGEVCSGGVPILAYGTPGRRGIYRHTMIGLHEPYLTSTTPDPAVLRAEVKTLESMRDRFYTLMAQLTQRRPSWWRHRLAGQSLIWIDAKEAIRWRLADVVLG